MTAPTPHIRLHVSPTGSDGNAGSPEAPLATLGAAVEALRRLRGGLPQSGGSQSGGSQSGESQSGGSQSGESQSGGLQSGGDQAGGAEIVLAGGRYRLEQPLELGERDSGLPGAPLLIRAAQGEAPVLSGAADLPADGFAPAADPAVLPRLPEAAAGHVLQLDLGTVGLGDADLGVFPLQFRGAPAAPELFVNDARMTLARWPNEGWATVAGIADPGTEPNADEPPRGGAFEYDGDRPARWDVKTGVWLVGYWGYDWYEEAIQVRAIDVGQRQIALAAPHVYTIRPDNPAPRRYRALNLLEELDEPGEYYIDRAARVLYFWPPEDLTGARISLSTLREPLIRLANCRHVTLRGLTVQEGLGCGIAIADGQSVAVEACTVRNVRDKGITIDGGVEHRVEACDLYGTGTGGVVAQGGDRRTLTPARHVVLNCHIHHFSCHQRTYASAIHLHGVGNRAAYNLVHDAPHMAIGLHGNDHLVEGNVVHHVCIETDDCGALYKGRDPSGTNNVIRHNFWHHIGNPLGHGNAAVYLDDGDVGDRIVGNVFFRCGEPGKGNFGSVFSHGGHDNTVDGNLFIECRRAIGSSPWSDKARKKHAETFDWRRLLLEDVDIARPPYTTRYPWLIGYWDMLPDRPRQNRARQNVFVMCGEISSGNWTWSPEENLVTDRDPGFRDAAAGDFRLDTDAAKGGPLAAIARIPFARLGLYASPLRPEPEREPWPYPPPKSLNG